MLPRRKLRGLIITLRIESAVMACDAEKDWLSLSLATMA